MLETTPCSEVSHRFGGLRGVQWRIDLGILPSSPSASVDDLRRVTANSRRRYAALRRQLLVDPHLPKDGGNSPDRVIDNPLSQNPDSMWGRFFKNAELEKMVDQDLTRLYPERGSYFQTSGCQSMLRRILLLWCLRHPECGYRQGMHELLAPLLFVLHADVERLLEKFSESLNHDDDLEKKSAKPSSLDELDPDIQLIVLLSDAYGAEGELGIVLSEKFMEHDAYCMFDALMGGNGGAVAMAEFFSPSPVGSSHTGFPPVIEASAALYHVLSIVDSSLYSHLVELGVEPQFFALRWLRVLFGREFSLEDLLLIWDEVFAHENTKKGADVDAESSFGILEQPRGAFICAFAVSMILNLRSSLLATENATICLQRLLNFPDGAKLMKLLEKAKSLLPIALNANASNSRPIYPGLYDGRKPCVAARRHSISLDGSSPNTRLNMVSDSYWEEKWRVLQKEEEKKRSSSPGEQASILRRGWTQRVRLRLSRTESDPAPSKENGKTKLSKPSVRRSLLKDLEKQLGLDEDTENTATNEEFGNEDSLEVSRDDINVKDSCGGSSSGAGSEENISNLSYPTSPSSGISSDNENEPERRSSVASNSSVEGNDAEIVPDCSPIPVSDLTDGIPPEELHNDDDSVRKTETAAKDQRKNILGKFHWLWKFTRNAGNDVSEGTNAPEDAKTCDGGSDRHSVASAISIADTSSSNGEVMDQNLMLSFKNLGQSMLENIQVIESVFQQDRGQMGTLENLSKNGLVGKGQVTAMAALKELRKISSLLSQM
ncbi:uncharacterized protein LOC127251796 isoform X2 [Andrographis paniculata]|uniref:uncharacterized protein LOC127251796 isoform X2 n=1 Tax=Andrographis paniculata TaxID=175694 RepID=UPI0021E8917C|nr:uncharacterized protein LOC127251796 isoform X2 [Andrographis paniculata]